MSRHQHLHLKKKPQIFADPWERQGLTDVYTDTSIRRSPIGESRGGRVDSSLALEPISNVKSGRTAQAHRLS